MGLIADLRHAQIKRMVRISNTDKEKEVSYGLISI